MSNNRCSTRNGGRLLTSGEADARGLGGGRADGRNRMRWVT